MVCFVNCMMLIARILCEIFKDTYKKQTTHLLIGITKAICGLDFKVVFMKVLESNAV